MQIEIVPYDHKSRLMYETVRIYAEVWERSADDALVFFRKYAKMRGYYAFAAVVNRRAIGFAFGTTSQPGQWWHDIVATHVGEDNPAMDDVWVLTELAVLAEYRNQQIGSDLLTHITKAQPCHNLLLSTQVSNVHAQRFYQRHGWDVLHPGIIFSKGREPYVIMHRALD